MNFVVTAILAYRLVICDQMESGSKRFSKTKQALMSGKSRYLRKSSQKLVVFYS